jgi:hypothetical protein
MIAQLRATRSTSCAALEPGEMRVAELLLPGALLMAMLAQLLAPFMPVDFCLAAFFQ